LEEIVELWADAALRLSDQDLKLMLRLAGAQTRLTNLRSAGGTAEAPPILAFKPRLALE
jgi:hypothetical protein